MNDINSENWTEKALEAINFSRERPDLLSELELKTYLNDLITMFELEIKIGTIEFTSSNKKEA